MKHHYEHPFWLKNHSGNNAFSFDVRSKKQLHVPSLITGTINHVKLGSEIVFSDQNETGKLQECF